MVVLDAVHQIQAQQANDLAVRWNCKAGKCGSCSAEINGMPKLMCMTRLNTLPLDQPVTIQPMRTFPLIKDLVTDVSWNFEVKKKIKPFKPRKPDAPDGTWRMQQEDVDRVQEFRKCIECFLCQDVCHVLRDHHMHEEFIGPRFFVYTAALEMHPLDTEDRLEDLKKTDGIGFCNITKCCTKVCPEEHHHHRQRDHSAEGAGGGPVFRSARQIVPRLPLVARRDAIRSQADFSRRYRRGARESGKIPAPE